MNTPNVPQLMVTFAVDPHDGIAIDPLLTAFITAPLTNFLDFDMHYEFMTLEVDIADGIKQFCETNNLVFREVIEFFIRA
jgi:hypothetical protein